MSQFTQVRAFPCILSFSSILEHPQQIKSWLAPMSSWTFAYSIIFNPLSICFCMCGLCVWPIHMCMPTLAHKESRARQLPLSLTLHLIALRQGLLVNLTTSPFWLAWLVGQQVLRICLSVSPCCSYRLTHYLGEDLNSGLHA